MFYSENTNGKTVANKTVKPRGTNLQQKKSDIFIHFIIPATKERLISKIFEIKL